MHNWSLIGFTLLTQSAIGLLWIGVLRSWLVPGPALVFPVLSSMIALLLILTGMITALFHVSRPGLAFHAMRNMSGSWLSREILLVHAVFVSNIVLVVFAQQEFVWAFRICGLITGVLGGLALTAMIQVYRIKTIPVWNSHTTTLEFVGSCLLLGGAVGEVLSLWPSPSVDHRISEGFLSVTSLILGIVLKLMAIAAAWSNDRQSDSQIYFKHRDLSLLTGHIHLFRTGLNLAGLLFISIFSGYQGLLWVNIGIGLCCFCSSDILGRWFFYENYYRLGI